MKKFTPVRQQAGYSLVELMIAGGLGIMLMAGVISVYVSGFRTSNLQLSLAEIQDRGRFVAQYLATDLQQAGWSDPDDVTQAAITSAIVFGSGATEDNVAACDASIDCDSIQLRYYATTDCLGAQVNGGAAGLVTNTYSVTGGNLQCTGAAGVGTTLISNVESFQLLYGVDDRDEGGGGSPDGIIDRYLAASDVPANVASRSILAIRYAILLKSDSTNTLDAEIVRQYTLLNEEQEEFNDRQLRVLFSGTVPVKNL